MLQKEGYHHMGKPWLKKINPVLTTMPERSPPSCCLRLQTLHPDSMLQKNSVFLLPLTLSDYLTIPATATNIKTDLVHGKFVR